MKKILILADFYYPKPLANGICLHQIALSLKSSGYEVHVLCFGKRTQKKITDLEGINVHHVRQRLFYNLREYGEVNSSNLLGKISYKAAMIINKIKKIALFHIYPLTSPAFLLRYYKTAKKLHQTHKFETVISVFNPLEAIATGGLLKKKYPKINYVVYTLDSLTNGAKIKFIPHKWTIEKGWRWEKRVYGVADLVLNMETHRNHHQQIKYNEFRMKMEFVDIPLLLNQPQLRTQEYQKTPESTGMKRLLYSGALDLETRNPKYLCDLILEINKHNNYTLDFFSRGNAEKLIRSYVQKSNNKIVQHGYVERSIIIDAMNSSDVLISIGNRGSQMIPSKIFEYMSTGKKIIHLFTEESDSSLFYYKNYPNALLINENEDLQVNLKKILMFLNENKELVPFNYLEEKFQKNLPEYTTRIIETFMK